VVEDSRDEGTVSKNLFLVPVLILLVPVTGAALLAAAGGTEV